MKKIKLFALAVMAMLGTNAMAQAVDFVNGKLKYQTVGTPSTIAPYKVNAVVNGVNGGASSLTGEVDIPGTFTQNINGLDYTVTVTAIADNGLQNALLSKITIPSTVKRIGAKAFTGCTSLAEIDLSNATGLTTLGANAFETTHITEFDFTACSLLSGFPAELFIETGQVNELVTKVLMPTSASFTTFNTALASLTKLETTNIADTKVTEIVANAFKDDAALKTVSLPGTVKTIATSAFEGSKVETLAIDVTSINTIAANAFSTVAAEQKALKSLTLTGTLKGTITAGAFPNLDGLTTFNLSGMSFGTNASIGAGAFGSTNNNNITSLELGAIGDNNLATATIGAGAFAFNKLANVKIGAITANQAIGAAAFGNVLEKVEIASIKSGGLAIVGGAFVFAANKNVTITIGEIRAINNTPVLGAAAFTLATAASANKTATITLGAITAKGGNFTEGAFGTTANYTGTGGVSMIFSGDIEENAIDKMLFTDASRLKSVTFNGAIATQGLKDLATTKGVFYGIMNGATVTFNGVLAENAVGNHAFEQTTPATDKLTVVYTATPADATKVPFKTTQAFGTAALGAAPYPVTLKISNADLAATIRAAQDAAGTDNYLFRVGLVQVVKSLVVFQKTGTNTAYGRFFLSAADFANGMTIARHQDGITYNLYMTYVEDDATDKIVTINMQPIPSFDGYYRLDPTAEPLASGEVILVKATGVSEAETEMKYTDFDGVQNTGADLFQALAAGTQKFKFSNTHTTNNQLINNTATPAELKNLFNAYPGGDQVSDIYFLSNPANGGGIKAQAWDIRSTGVYVAVGSYYAVAPYYASAAGARTARIVWNDGDDNTTGIESIVKKAAAKNSVMYNLSGQKVDANYKGIVIKNGQKMIQK